jgi:hypothetical protein
MLLISGGTKTWLPLILSEPEVFGILIVPRAGNSLPESIKWAADNGAFTGFDEVAFLAMLQRHMWAKDRCLWVAAPDVVGDAKGTLRLFKKWEPRIHALGYRVAFVAQDWSTSAQIPWSSLDALFIGGSDSFKLGPVAVHTTAIARTMGKWVHMGRVNSAKRLRYASAIGVDSVDGTGWSRFGDSMLSKHGKLLRELAKVRKEFRACLLHLPRKRTR